MPQMHFVNKRAKIVDITKGFVSFLRYLIAQLEIFFYF
jgi:hypothetical protein